MEEYKIYPEVSKKALIVGWQNKDFHFRAMVAER